MLLGRRVAGVPIGAFADWLGPSFGLPRHRSPRPKKLPVILVGDSGQRDPEIDAEIATQRPARVAAVYSRDLQQSRRRSERSPGPAPDRVSRALSSGAGRLAPPWPPRPRNEEGSRRADWARTSHVPRALRPESGHGRASRASHCSRRLLRWYPGQNKARPPLRSRSLERAPNLTDKSKRQVTRPEDGAAHIRGLQFRWPSAPAGREPELQP